MKKQFCAVLLGAALALALAGCGGSGSSQPQSSSAAASGAASAAASSSAARPASGSEAEPSAAQPFYGVWEVKDVQFASTSALSSEDAAQYIGAVVEYQNDAITCNGETIASGTLQYTSALYDEATLTEEFRVNLGEWWNAISEVTFVEAEPAAGVFGGQFFVADDQTLWIYHEGAFFLARPAA